MFKIILSILLIYATSGLAQFVGTVSIGSVSITLQLTVNMTVASSKPFQDVIMRTCSSSLSPRIDINRTSILAVYSGSATVQNVQIMFGPPTAANNNDPSEVAANLMSQAKNPSSIFVTTLQTNMRNQGFFVNSNLVIVSFNPIIQSAQTCPDGTVRFDCSNACVAKTDLAATGLTFLCGFVAMVAFLIWYPRARQSALETEENESFWGFPAKDGHLSNYKGPCSCCLCCCPCLKVDEDENKDTLKHTSVDEKGEKVQDPEMDKAKELTYQKWFRIIMLFHPVLATLWPPKYDGFNRRQRFIVTLMEWGVSLMVNCITFQQFANQCNLHPVTAAIVPMILSIIVSLMLRSPVEYLARCVG